MMFGVKSMRAHWAQRRLRAALIRRGPDNERRGQRCARSEMGPTLKARIQKDHWQAFIDQHTFGQSAPNTWIDVPPAHILDHEPNPTGSAVACWFSGKILCFIRPAET
jgi:hypothetical protein